MSTLQSKPSVGVIGLGSMGMGVATSLLKAGFSVYGFDVRPEALRAFQAEGGSAAPTPAEAAKHAPIIITMVVNAAQTQAVLFGEDGAVPYLGTGAVVIASSTMPPAFARDLAERLAAEGILMIDAPVSGGAAKAREGALSIMASGPAEAFDKAAQALDAIAAKVYRLGDQAGAGSTVKMVNQLLAGVHIAVAAEAVALGVRAGVDPHVLYDVITHSAGNSWMFQNRVPHILAGDYTPLSSVNIFVKDLGIVLETGKQLTFPLPITATAQQLFLMASAAGYGNIDDSAVVKVYADNTGIELPGDELGVRD